MQGLKDIKPLVAVPDHSLLILLGLMIALLIMIGALVAWLKRPKRRRRKKLSPKEKALQTLKAISFEDTKKSVYDFSENMHILIPDEKKEQLQKLLKKLEVYKYKKEVPSLSDADKKVMKSMIEEVGNV